MLKRFLGVFGLTAGGALLSFLAQMLAARWLGQRDYGFFSYVCAIATTISLLAPLGYQGAGLRYLAQYRVLNESHLFRSFLCHARVTTLSVSLAGACAVLVWGLSSNRDQHASTGLGLVALAMVVPMAAYSRLSVSVLRVTGHVRSAVGLDAPLREGIMALLFLLAIITSVGRSVDIAVLTFAFGFAMSSLLLIHRERAALGLLSNPTVSVSTVDNRREWRRLAAAMLLMTFSQLAIKRLDVFIIGTINGTDHVGLYAVALRFSEALQLPFTAGSVLVASRIAELNAAGQAQALQTLLSKAAQATVILTSLGALPLLVAPSVFLGLFGSEFVHADTMLRLLVVGQLANAATGYASGLLTMTGHERTALTTMAAVGCVNLLGNCVLAGIFGPVGVAFGSMIAMTLCNVLLWLLAWKQTGVNAAVTSLRVIWRIGRG